MLGNVVPFFCNPPSEVLQFLLNCWTVPSTSVSPHLPKIFSTIPARRGRRAEKFLDKKQTKKKNLDKQQWSYQTKRKKRKRRRVRSTVSCATLFLLWRSAQSWRLCWCSMTTDHSRIVPASWKTADRPAVNTHRARPDSSNTSNLRQSSVGSRIHSPSAFKMASGC